MKNKQMIEATINTPNGNEYSNQNHQSILEVKFVAPLSDASAVSDAENCSAKSCDPCVPCVTDGE